MRVAAREHGAQLAQPFAPLDHLLAAHVAATFRPHLVFEEQPGGAGAVIEFDGAQHVQRVAVTGVGVDQHRPRGQATDAPRRVGHLGLGQIAEVGLAEQRGGDAESAHEQHIEAGLVRQACAHAVIDAAQDVRAVLPAELADPLSTG